MLHVMIIRLAAMAMGVEAERKYKVWLRAEIVLLFVVIVIVWALLLLPVVFYYLPVDIEKFNATDGHEILRQGPTCAVPIIYTGKVCQKELLSLKSCYLGDQSSTDYPAVATDDHLEGAELALSFVKLMHNPKSNCAAAEVKQFLCLYFFGLCDFNTLSYYQPSASQCRNLRDNICAQEWIAAINLGLELPDCDVDFPAESISCRPRDKGEERDETEDTSLSGSGSDFFPTTIDSLPTTQSSGCSNITCREGFYCIDGTNDIDDAECNPSCASWKQFPDSINAVSDSLLLMSTCIGLISGVGVLIGAGLRRNKVLTFPSSLAVYQTITVLVSGLFVLVSYVDNSSLYCTSNDLYISLYQATPFCILAGATFYYCSLQLSMFWLCHILTIFWGLKFPFQARNFRKTHRMKYLHIACVTICILIPVIPILATMIKYSHGKPFREAVKGGLGFTIVRFPPILCFGRDKDTVFYTFILPLVVLLMVGMTVLIFVFWIIHKQHGLFQARRSKNPHKTGTAERKILIVFVYYVLLAVFAVLGFSLANRDAERFTTEVIRYFECERKGVDPDNPCDTSSYESIPNIYVAMLSYVLIGMYPLINFIYVIDVQELKQHLRDRFPSMNKRSVMQKTTGTKIQGSSNNSTAGMLSSYSQEV